MKKVVYIALIALLSLPAFAQDMQILSERDINGSARYMGMAGAMTAVGGDPSAVQDNPAAAGVYRRFEISTTLNELIDKSSYALRRNTVSSFQFPQLNFVFAFGSDRNVGLKYSNIQFTFNRIKTFNRNTTTVASPTVSVVDVMADKTQGLAYSSIVGCGNVWNNSEIGWLSVLGFDAYLINPLAIDSSCWVKHLYGLGEQEVLNVEENGYLDEFNIVWGGNINDRVYIGAGVNIRNLYYRKYASIVESLPNGQSMTLESVISSSGYGLNGSVGIIAQPVQFLRLGASFQTPSIINMRTQTYASVKSYGMTYDSAGRPEMHGIETPTDTYRRGVGMPLRVTAGAAFQFKRYALLSFEYDYQWWKNQDATHTFKVGTEAVVAHNWFFNLGYACSTTFASSDYVRVLSYNSVYVDTDTRNVKISHYAGAAFGFRNNFVIAQLGYQYRWQHNHVYAHELQTTPYEVNYETHRIVLTLGWHNAR